MIKSPCCSSRSQEFRQLTAGSVSSSKGPNALSWVPRAAAQGRGYNKKQRPLPKAGNGVRPGCPISLRRKQKGDIVDGDNKKGQETLLP